jgi:hypothetical protein
MVNAPRRVAVRDGVDTVLDLGPRNDISGELP